MDYDNFVPPTFLAPEQRKLAEFGFYKLSARHVYLDYVAVMSSIDLIRKTRGGSWPTPELTFEDNLIDLAWHQREFEHQHSFAFTILSPDATTCLGCLYFYPPNFRKAAPQGAQVDVSFWVTQKAYEMGLFGKVKEAIETWLKEAWPWQSHFWSNEQA